MTSSSSVEDHYKSYLPEYRSSKHIDELNIERLLCTPPSEIVAYASSLMKTTTKAISLDQVMTVLCNQIAFPSQPKHELAFKLFTHSLRQSIQKYITDSVSQTVVVAMTDEKQQQSTINPLLSLVEIKDPHMARLDIPEWLRVQLKTKYSFKKQIDIEWEMNVSGGGSYPGLIAPITDNNTPVRVRGRVDGAVCVVIAFARLSSNAVIQFI